MAVVNDTLRKVTVLEPEVKNINGTDVYLDHDDNVIRSEKHKNKAKRFAAATNKLNEKMPDEKDHELTLAEMMAMQKQNY